MSRWVVLLALVLTACSQPAAAPVAHATTSPSGKASNPGISPTLISDLPLSAVTFSCRLPVYAIDGSAITDGVINFRSGDVAVDPSGNKGVYFDRAYSRWLPVPRSAVAPDSTHYAYIDNTQTDFVLHVVAVSGGNEIRFTLSSQGFNGQPPGFDYSADGVYLVNAFEHLLAGLWLVDPAIGSIRQVSKDILPVLSAGNGIFWAEKVNPGDPSPVQTGTSIGTLSNQIDRVDVRSGEQTKWLYLPGKGVGVVGLDSRGLPLIESRKWGYDPNAELFQVAGPNAPRLIYIGALVSELQTGISDAHGVWFGGPNGIYLYTNSGALIKVSNHCGYPANGCF